MLWITGNTGIYYGMKKNMVEILPFSTTAAIDGNPGLAGQQTSFVINNDVTMMIIA